MKRLLLIIVLIIPYQINAQRYFQYSEMASIPSVKTSMGELSFIIEDPLSDPFIYASKIGLSKQNTVFFAPGTINLHQNERVLDQRNYEYRYITVSTPAGLIIGLGDFTFGFVTEAMKIKYIFRQRDSTTGLYSFSHNYYNSAEYQWFAGFRYGKLSLGISNYNDFYCEGISYYNFDKIMVGLNYSFNTKSTLSFDCSFSKYNSNNYRIEFSTLIGKETKIAFVGESADIDYCCSDNSLWSYTLGGGITSRFSNFLLAGEICYKPSAWEHNPNNPYYFIRETNHNWEFKLGIDYFIYSNFNISAGINYLIENRQREYQNPIDERVKDYSYSPGITTGLNYKLKNFDFKYIFIHHTYKPLLADTDIKHSGFNNGHFLLISYNF